MPSNGSWATLASRQVRRRLVARYRSSFANKKPTRVVGITRKHARQVTGLEFWIAAAIDDASWQTGA